MASKEATKAEEKAQPAEHKEKADFKAFEFTLLKDKIGEKTTNPQVKSKVNDAFLGYGAFDECRVIGAPGADRTVTVFFARLFGKGQPAWEALQAKQKATIKIYDEDVELRLTDATPSGGGATSGTAARPAAKKEGAKKEAGRGRGRGRGAAGADGKEAPKGEAPKEGESKEGGRGRGRGRPKQEEKKESLQRGRANIGGKLGPVSKVRLARQAKEARDKENAARIARGEKPLEDEKKKGEEEEPKLPAKGGKDAGKKEGGKKEGGKAEGKKEGGKAAGKAEGKKEGAKKGK